MEENIECGGFTFYNNFDSANLARVEKVEVNKDDNGKNENNKSHKNSSTVEPPSFEFNIWTKQDCQGTEFQNNNRTWFYFGIKAAKTGINVKLNLVNLNKQVKMFSQGMTPVVKVVPGHPQWERIKDKPTFIADEKKNEFVLSFNYRTPENPNAITYFAFTYPFSYTELQNHLKKIDAKMTKLSTTNLADDIYYHRECAIKSLEGRRLDILTISSYHNIMKEREAKIKDLFTEDSEERPFKFQDKKIIFISARVHPGETPSSFVLNGFLNLLINREDQIAITLRRLYVFKLIPMLNPDGVAQGYYRMDTRGVNLNRLYLNPSKTEHPTIFAANSLLRYYHHSYNLPEDNREPEVNVPEIINKNSLSLTSTTFDSTSNLKNISSETTKLLQRVTLMSLEEKNKCMEQGSRIRNCLLQAEKSIMKNQDIIDDETTSFESMDSNSYTDGKESGLFMYLDFHGHASKKGIFMYGNHFDDPEDSSACMLLPKLMSINNPNFHFTSCNFAEKNMYLVDKRDGMSREGSGRVAVYKLTGLIHSYTLECNYNTGRLVNTVPARIKEGLHKIHGQLFIPPKYNPTVFEEVGAAIGPSILDMTSSNPNSRLPNSQYRSLKGLMSYLKLISTNPYQTTLNKPSNKSNGSNRLSQDSGSDEAIDTKSPKSNFSTNNSVTKPNPMQNIEKKFHKYFRTANIYETFKKLKNNKRSNQAVNRNIQKYPAGRKNHNRETKVNDPPQIITTHVKLKLNTTPQHKKVNNNASSKLNSPAVKVIEKNHQRVKLPSVILKSGVFRRTVLKKQAKHHQIKSSIIRQKFQQEIGNSETSKKSKPTKVIATSHNKKAKKNYNLKSNKNKSTKSEHKNHSKMSSISKI